MLEEIYGWIQNISVYLIVMAAVMHAIPGKDYGKYIRFFSGLVLILLLSTPLLKLAGMEGTFRTLYRGRSMSWSAGKLSGLRKSMSSLRYLNFWEQIREKMLRRARAG